ncbi:MAG: TIGR02996 domain-containing protein [Polyangiaceae bacterium]
MGRWYTDPARNRPTVDAWANDPARAADSLTLARPAAPRQLEARGPALLRAVLERPDDDEPRLVYADWLTEQGDARGELIQVQCELAGMALSRERRRALRAREKQLLQGSRAALASLEALSESSSIERGLVSGVTLFAPKLVKHCAELRASHPIVHFEVVASKPEELVKLAALAPLMGVPKLTIQARRTPRIYQSRAHLALVATAKSPIWSRTRELGLEHVDDSDEEWGAFFSGLAAPELDTLVTRAAQFTPTALRALAASGSLPALRRVVLDYPAMGQSAEGAGEVAAALSALAARGVRGLGLHSWHMGDTALASCLRAFTDHGTLTDLSIVNCKFGPRTLEWLSGAKQLERLEMGNNGRWGLSLVELADCVRSLSKLREVVLHERDVAREAAAAMTDAWMALPSLERVRLRESPLTDEEVERLMRHTGYWE